MLPSLIKLRCVGVALALLGAAVASAAGQRVPDVLPRYRVGALDYGLIGVVSAVGMLPAVLGDRLPHAGCAPCDASTLWGLDRGAVGDVRTGPARVSDVTLLATLVGGGTLVHVARRHQSGAARWEDLVVFARAVTVSGAVTTWAQVLVQRPRPPRYSASAVQYPEADYGRSFPSGHTSTAFAAAAAYTSILQRRGEVGRHKAEIALLFGAATLTGALRVAARKHFPTDVMAGAVLGGAIGWAIPRLHAVR